MVRARIQPHPREMDRLVRKLVRVLKNSGIRSEELETWLLMHTTTVVLLYYFFNPSSIIL